MTTSPARRPVRFAILGPLQVERGGSQVRIGGRHQQMLLAALLVERNRVVSTDRLLEILWRDERPDTALNILQVSVSKLRKLLEPDPGARGIIRTESPGYVLRVDPRHVDADRFEDLVRTARSAAEGGNIDAAVRGFTEALSEWRGPALSEVATEPFAQAEAARLEEIRLSALEDRAEAELSLGRHVELVPQLEKQVAEHPLRERLRASLMLALYRAGQQAEAVEEYLDTRRVLNADLGVEPGPDLQELYRRILNHEDDLNAPAVSATSKVNVPAQLTAFVGREREIAQVRDALSNSRLVTLFGPAGCGKTRLAYQVAADIAAAYAHGVWVVELADLRDGSLVASTVADALGIGEQPGRDVAGTLESQLAARSMLVVMDNCEHLLDESARLTERLLRASPNLSILATSRQPLGVPGEVTFDIPPLQMPADGESRVEELARSESVGLFVDRATAADTGFTLDGSNASAVAEVCRRLDGMPLAIELAAARIRALPVGEIAERLDDRFRVLTAGARTIPRHTTLQAAMDWSYKLLPEPERIAFQRLAVFAGPFCLQAAEQVCEGDPINERDVVDVVAGLRDRSLLSVHRRRDQTRYRMLESVRAYARDRLEASGEGPAVRDRHASYFLSLAEQAEPHLRGTESSWWVARFELDFDDLRAAWHRFEAGERIEEQLRLAAALGRFFYLAGHYREGRRWLETALARGLDADAGLRARVAHGAGMLAFLGCDYDTAADRCVNALTAFREVGDGPGEAMCLTTLGSIARERAEYDLALSLHGEALERSRFAGDRWGEGHALQMSGFASWLCGAFDRAREASGKSLEIFRVLGDQERIGWTITDLGAVALYEGRPADARERLEEAHRLFRDIGFPEGVAWTLNLLGVVAIREGRPDAARATLEEALSIHRELGDRWRIASVLEALATVHAAIGAPVDATHLLGEARALREQIGAPVPRVERDDHAATLAALRAALSGEDFEAALAEGRRRGH